MSNKLEVENESLSKVELEKEEIESLSKSETEQEKTESLPKAEIDLETGETTVTDESGQVVEESKLGDRVKYFLKKSFEYSPMGLSYTMSRGIMDRSMDLFDRAINSNDLNKVEEIKFSDIIDLIKDGQDKFKELDLSFNASKVNGINLSGIREAVEDKNISVDFGKKGDLQLNIKVTYK
jgi:hypothetical protein